jgi:hypothetical protein
MKMYGYDLGILRGPPQEPDLGTTEMRLRPDVRPIRPLQAVERTCHGSARLVVTRLGRGGEAASMLAAGAGKALPIACRPWHHAAPTAE